ncbi:tRNA lysidine(34) synthetase TilS [Neorhizobium sp. JUb45]|uniref:tRNA lysidine(34) synthetase TilS n=1 Tax=unclassified Neorhizobium TaxID=2629175 RepID=UPI0010E4C942|nr:tRNA lysidine(34) synthetase TilS [Neorhizobium sp. JUb45]TCR06534.1 tRNA(Ile)-lysidine synthase [Neorhizobium sp. JUb45]
MTPPPHSTIAGHPDRSLPLMSALSGFLADFKKPAHLLVAISGGSDSTGLLVGLHSALSAFPDIRISAATIDHALRPEAAEEARAVAALCEKLRIFHVTRRWQGEKPATGISAAAREARYSLLSAIADEIGATAIVTGHTLDDQIETVVMRAGRSGETLPPPSVSFADISPSTGEIEGAMPPRSSVGLSGMAPATLLDTRHWILRPLLHTRRADIRAWLTDNAVGWVDDPSNVDPHYERVRIRQALAFEPAIDPAIIATAAQAREKLAQDGADWLAACATIEHAVIAKITLDGLRENPIVVRHALSTLAAVLGGRPHNLSRESADRLMAFITGSRGRMTAGRVVFDLRRDGLFMLRENRNLPHVTVPPGETVVWDGRLAVTSHVATPIEVLPGRQSTDGFENLASGLAKLAARVLPHAACQGEGALAISPHLAVFDRFLPVYDLPLASRIAALMGRGAYLLPPV